MKHRKKNKLAIGGLLLMLAALCPVAYNVAEQVTADSQADAVEQQLEPVVQARQNSTDSDVGGTAEVGDKRYCGILQIPSLSLKLPVNDELNDANLKESPCRYRGSTDKGGLVVAGHNYWRHFGRLRDLRAGDEVSIDCPRGAKLRYEVLRVETLPGSAVKEMTAGDWDLTLFTCTPDSASRVTVRCKLRE